MGGRAALHTGDPGALGSDRHEDPGEPEHTHTTHVAYVALSEGFSKVGGGSGTAPVPTAPMHHPYCTGRQEPPQAGS